MPASNIRRAPIDDATLEALVCQHRDNAGQAERLHNKPVDQDRWRNTQNGWADLFQELLDRRRSATATHQ